VTWSPIEEEVSSVSAFNIYLASSSDGEDRSLLDRVSLGTNYLTVPMGTSRGGLDWILIYGEIEAAEVESPAYLLLHDDIGTVPPSSPSELSFQDIDAEVGQLGGAVEFTEPDDLAPILSYVVFLAGDSLGTSQESLDERRLTEDESPGVVPVLSTSASVPEGTLAGSFDWLLVYARNAYGDAESPGAAAIYDETQTALPDVTVEGVSFEDEDPAAGYIAGVVTWEEPDRIAAVSYFQVALAADSSGSQLSSTFMVEGGGSFGTTLQRGTTYASDALAVLVFAGNTVGLQRNGGSALLYDDTGTVPAISVSSILFEDEDDAAGSIAGLVTWTPPDVVATIIGYDIALATDMTGGNEVQVSSVARGTNFLMLSAQVRGDHDYLLIYTRSFRGRQVIPASALLHDKGDIPPQTEVTALSFIDTDVAIGSASGWVTWDPPEDLGTLTEFLVHVETSTTLTEYDPVLVGTNAMFIPTTGLSDGANISVYAANDIGASPLGAHITVQDIAAPTVVASNISFVDTDVERLQLSGTVQWSLPAELPTWPAVTGYALYAAEDLSGMNAVQLAFALGDYATTLTLEAAPISASSSYLLLYAFNTDAEAAQASWLPVVDISAPTATVRNLSFIDEDLRNGFIAGQATWLPPAFEDGGSAITSYGVYVATSAGGGGRTLVLEAAATGGLQAAELPEIEQPQDSSYSYVVVYASSEYGEQSQGAEVHILDVSEDAITVVVTNLSFTDEDLRAGSISGIVSWTAPTAASTLVTGYSVFLTNAASNPTEWTQVAEAAASDSSVGFSSDTQQLYTHIMVLPVGTSPAQSAELLSALLITDSSSDGPASQVMNISFADTDTRGGYVSGELTWWLPDYLADVAGWAAVLIEDVEDLSDARTIATVDDVNVETVKIGPLEIDESTFYLSVLAVGHDQGLRAAAGPILALADNAVVSNITFQDTDASLGTIGGRVTWTPQSSQPTVTHYAIYLSSWNGTMLQAVGSVGYDTNSFLIPAGTVARELLLVYSVSIDGVLPLDAASISLIDRAVPSGAPSSVVFEDTNFNEGFISGTVSVTLGEALAQDGVTAVVLYWVSSDIDILDDAAVFLGQIARVADLEFVIDSSFPVPEAATHIAAFALNDLGEGEDGTLTRIVDRYLPTYVAHGLNFTDTDLDKDEISGLVTVRAADLTADILGFNLYFGFGNSSIASSLLLDIPLTSAEDVPWLESGTVPPETPVPSILVSSLLVFAYSSAGQASQGLAVSFEDRAVPLAPQGVSFHDEDLVMGQIAGIIAVARTTDTGVAANAYVIYRGAPGCQSETLIATLTIDASSEVHLDSPNTACAEPFLNETHVGCILQASDLLDEQLWIMAFAVGDLGARPSCAEQAIQDRGLPEQPPQGLRFSDTDLGVNLYGGNIELEAADIEDSVEGYSIYFGTDAERLELIATLPVGGSNSVILQVLPQGTVMPAGATHMLAYSRNSDGEMASGVAALVIDEIGLAEISSSLSVQDVANQLDGDALAEPLVGALSYALQVDNSSITLLEVNGTVGNESADARRLPHATSRRLQDGGILFSFVVIVDGREEAERVQKRIEALSSGGLLKLAEDNFASNGTDVAVVLNFTTRLAELLAEATSAEVSSMNVIVNPPGAVTEAVGEAFGEGQALQEWDPENVTVVAEPGTDVILETAAGFSVWITAALVSFCITAVVSAGCASIRPAVGSGKGAFDAEVWQEAFTLDKLGGPDTSKEVDLRPLEPRPSARHQPASPSAPPPLLVVDPITGRLALGSPAGDPLTRSSAETSESGVLSHPEGSPVRPYASRSESPSPHGAHLRTQLDFEDTHSENSTIYDEMAPREDMPDPREDFVPHPLHRAQRMRRGDLAELVLEAQEAAARQDDGDRRPRPLDALLADGQPLDEVEFSAAYRLDQRPPALFQCCDGGWDRGADVVPPQTVHAISATATPLTRASVDQDDVEDLTRPRSTTSNLRLTTCSANTVGPSPFRVGRRLFSREDSLPGASVTSRPSLGDLPEDGGAFQAPPAADVNPPDSPPPMMHMEPYAAGAAAEDWDIWQEPNRPVPPPPPLPAQSVQRSAVPPEEPEAVIFGSPASGRSPARGSSKHSGRQLPTRPLPLEPDFTWPQDAAMAGIMPSLPSAAAVVHGPAAIAPVEGLQSPSSSRPSADSIPMQGSALLVPPAAAGERRISGSLALPAPPPALELPPSSACRKSQEGAQEILPSFFPFPRQGLPLSLPSASQGHTVVGSPAGPKQKSGPLALPPPPPALPLPPSSACQSSQAGAHEVQPSFFPFPEQGQPLALPSAREGRAIEGGTDALPLDGRYSIPAQPSPLRLPAAGQVLKGFKRPAS